MIISSDLDVLYPVKTVANKYPKKIFFLIGFKNTMTKQLSETENLIIRQFNKEEMEKIFSRQKENDFNSCKTCNSF